MKASRLSTVGHKEDISLRIPNGAVVGGAGRPLGAAVAKGPGDLPHAVGAEVEEDQHIVVLHAPRRVYDHGSEELSKSRYQ